MDDASATDRWREERTPFQRVYDVLVGSQTFLTAQELADHADCSETVAQDALEQLSEMLIAERQDGRPVRYQRNESSLRWKRVLSACEGRRRVRSCLHSTGDSRCVTTTNDS